MSSDIVIEPIGAQHIDSYHRALDTVARERRYLTFLEAPSLEDTTKFVLDMIKNKHSQFVALKNGEVVGWCDIRRHFQPTHSHRGTLGMGIAPAHRDRGLGHRLIVRTLEDAREKGVIRVELSVHSDTNGRSVSMNAWASFGRASPVMQSSSMAAIWMPSTWR